MRIAKRILCVLLICILVFNLHTAPKARAYSFAMYLGMAFAATLFSLGASAAIEQSRTGQPAQWIQAIPWQEMKNNMEEWGRIMLTTCETEGAISQEMQDAINGTNWASKVDETTGKVSLTYDDVMALKTVGAVAFPHGVQVKQDTASAELGASTVNPTTIIMNQNVPVGTGSYACTADLYKAYVNGVSMQQVNASGTVITNYPTVTMFTTRLTNYIVTGSYGYSYSAIPIVFCVTGSACYDYLIANTAWGVNKSTIMGKAGYITVLGSTSNYVNKTDLVSNMPPSTYVDGTVIKNGVDSYGSPAIEYTNVSGTKNQQVLYRITSNAVVSVPTVVDTIKLDDAQYNAMVTAWANAITAGNATAADEIKFAIAQSNAELAQQLTGSIAQQIEATNASTEAIVNAIIAATAAAAATGAGELDLSRMTLAQAVQTRFPFCIPFDLANAFSMFSAGSSAPPVWPVQWHVMGQTVSFTIDMTVFEPWAKIIRWSVLVVFNIGLILITRKIVRG